MQVLLLIGKSGTKSRVYYYSVNNIKVIFVKALLKKYVSSSTTLLI